MATVVDSLASCVLAPRLAVEDQEMTTPTPEALARVIVKRFARGKPEDVDLSSHDWYVREITTALAERERAVWEAAAEGWKK